MRFPLFKVHIDKKEAIKEIEKVFDSGFFNEGVQVEEFSNKISASIKADNIVMTNSCTSALTMALKLSNVKPGDEVISTSMTCLATNTPILNLGAKIIWADINPYTGNICPLDVANKITDKTKAVMCVNWAGLPCDLTALMDICNRKNIKLIQDAAHSFGSTYGGSDISSHAHYTCYSFQAIKHITCGDGGALVCLDDSDFIEAKKLKWFGLDRENTKDKNGEWKGQRWNADVEKAGYKFNMNNISAAIGLSQIKHLKKIISSHRDNAKKYVEAFSKTDKIKPLIYPPDSEPSYWVFTALLDSSIDRDRLLSDLNKFGIGAGLVHVPNDPYSCFHESKADLPGVNFFHNHQISLPCGWWLSSEDIDIISNKVLSLISERQ